MRKFISILCMVLLTLGLVMHDAQAKRFGGGRSFGMSRSISNPTRSFGTPQRSGLSNPWVNRLAGLALGGLLAYLFMSNGLASGIIAWLLVAGAVLLLVSLWRQRKQAMAQSGAYNTAFKNHYLYNASHPASQVAGSGAFPADFDSQTFLRDVKAQFIQLQAAYDQKNTRLIRELTTPEAFAEIQLQLHERGNAENFTEVVTLDAVLLDTATESTILFDREEKIPVASVRFSGMIREDSNEPALAFNEIWHFQKDMKSSRWIVAGIQQS